jgi:hypothetical protein
MSRGVHSLSTGAVGANKCREVSHRVLHTLLDAQIQQSSNSLWTPLGGSKLKRSVWLLHRVPVYFTIVGFHASFICPFTNIDHIHQLISTYQLTADKAAFVNTRQLSVSFFLPLQC